MAKRVVLSLIAHSDRKKILDYWRHRNKSTTYARKLNQLFRDSFKIISDFPDIGKPTDQTFVRVKVVKDYLVVYRESESQILILTIWDTRQNPDDLKKIIS